MSAMDKLKMVFQWELFAKFVVPKLWKIVELIDILQSICLLYIIATNRKLFRKYAMYIVYACVLYIIIDIP